MINRKKEKRKTIDDSQTKRQDNAGIDKRARKKKIYS